MSPTNLENIEPPSWQADIFTSDNQLSKLHEGNGFASDYYEVLRVAPQADQDTIERVYSTLAERFHPDNQATGNLKTFLGLREAYETLSNQAQRARYNVVRQQGRGATRFSLRGGEFFDGVRGGQNRRLAVLCLLYRRRITAHESPGLSILDLEQLTGCTPEEVTATLWYLCDKQWATIGELTAYSITAEGFDFVEGKLEDRFEFRALATVSYYPAESESPAQAESRPYRKNGLPLDIAPAILSEEDFLIDDYYNVLGIGQHADEETIERVYRTLADRFHQDKPGPTGEKTFLRIREAYNTLSDRAQRAEYDAQRGRTRYSERFRLQGREFFDGIRGEQNRRLAVLCLLYRQAASELGGLTVLDLEQLTGCTREELGSALWYLREKKWAKSGEYTQYSITAAGFDVVENKLDDREAARSRAWRRPEDAPGTEFAYQQVSAEQTGEQSRQNVPLASSYLIGDTTITPENWNSQFAGMSPTDIFQQLLRLREGVNPSDEPLEVRPVLTQPEEASGVAGQASRLADQEEAKQTGRANSWTSLIPDDLIPDDLIQDEPGGNEPLRPQERTAPAADHSQPKVQVAPQPSEAALEGKSLLSSSLVSNSPASNSPASNSPASNSMGVSQETASGVAVNPEKRVIFSMGGKGGVGKTSVMTGLAEWFEENQIPATLLDLDTENKACGSLTHFFGGRIPKINIHTPAGLDAFVDHLSDDAQVILADMGAGAGQVTHEWFDKMYPDVAEARVAFTAIGVVTSDPASVESILNWSTALQDRVNYIVVENNLTEHADFTYWREGDEAQEFRRRFQPAIVRLDYRIAELENAARNYGATLGRIAGRTTKATELQKASMVMRAQSYRRRIFAELDKVKELLLP